MVVRLANKITDQFEKENFISHELREHYVYALITMIERALTIASIVGLSLIVDEFVPSIIFLLAFFSLRRHTGGYHVKYFWLCYLESLVIYIGILFLSHVITGYMGIVYVCLIIALIYICIIGTVNHPNMAMEYSELAESKKAARHMVLLQFGLILTMAVIGGAERYIGIMSMAVILCAALMLIAKIKKQEVKCSEAG